MCLSFPVPLPLQDDTTGAQILVSLEPGPSEMGQPRACVCSSTSLGLTEEIAQIAQRKAGHQTGFYASAPEQKVINICDLEVAEVSQLNLSGSQTAAKTVQGEGHSAVPSGPHCKMEQWQATSS